MKGITEKIFNVIFLVFYAYAGYLGVVKGAYLEGVFFLVTNIFCLLFIKLR